jgi:site-specific DNA recombinase
MKAAIYSRKSKFTGKGESIENQIQLCKEYTQIQLKDKNIDEFFIYEDEGFSGGNTNRPEFKKLMEDVKTKKFDVLICYRLDRISRNVADFSTTLGILQQYNIDFVSIREQFDTSSPMGRAMIYIASVFAQLERETIAERVRDNMLELAKTGRWLGGVCPIGYESDPITYIDDNMNERKMVKLKQVPEELKIVKLLFEKYLEFKSLSKVETYCLQNNIKTKKGSDFSKSNLRIVLNNPVYVKSTKEVLNYLENEDITVCGIPDNEHGILTYNKQKTIMNDKGNTVRKSRDKAEWIAAVSSQPGIIVAKDFLQVQHILSENKDKTPNLGKTHNALLTGLLKCSKCGSNMQVSHGHVSKKTGEKIYYYACSMKKFSKGSRCDCKNAKAAELDAAMIKYMKELALRKKSILENLAEQNKKTLKANLAVNREESIIKTLSDKEKQIENLMNKLAIDEDISDLIISKIKSIKNEMTEMKKELSNIKEAKFNYEQTEIDLEFIGLLLDKCSIIGTLCIEEQKQLLDFLINSIIYDGETEYLDVDFIGSGTSKKK